MQREVNFSTRGAGWSRRRFLGQLGGAGTALLLPHMGRGEAAADGAESCLLCVGSFGGGDTGTLHVVAPCGGRWRRSRSAATERPMALAAHPVLPVIYVANGVQLYQGEPRGTVEAFHVDRVNGRLESLARQALSLSATEPRSLAVAPDGRSLLVAAFGGGAYNILPLDDAGVPGAPTAILKRVGRSSPAGRWATAHPAAVVFHPHEGWALGADAGAERLDLLSPQGPEIAVTHRVHGELWSGVAIDGTGRVAIAMQRTRPALVSFRIAERCGLTALDHVLLDSVPAAITFHPKRQIVYCATQDRSGRCRLEAWQVQSTTGGLRRLAAPAIPAGDVRALQSAGNMLALASNRGLVTVALDRETAEPHSAQIAVAIPEACSVVVLSS